jgi:hypothetical protein
VNIVNFIGLGLPCAIRIQKMQLNVLLKIPISYVQITFVNLGGKD